MLLAAVWLLVVLHLLSGLAPLKTASVVLLAAFLLCAVPRASVHIRLLFAAGVAASLWSILGAGDWAPVRGGLEAGVIVGAFFPTVLLLRATADQSPLLGATREGIERLDERQRETWVQAVSHLLGSFLMIGGYLIARSALPRQLPEHQRVRLAQSGVIGLCLSGCWSPFFLASAIASQLVPTVKAWQLVCVGLLFAAMGWTLSKLLFYRGVSMTGVLRDVAIFAVPSGVLVAIVIVVSLFTGLSSLQAIVLVMPVFCLGYLSTLGWPATRRALARVPSALGHLSDEMIVFTVSMILGAVAASSGAERLLSVLLAGISGVPLLLIAAEAGLIASLGYLGVHPMITATLMLPVLAGTNRQLADLAVAYIVVLGWGLSSMVSIWQLPVASAATTFEVPVRRLAFGRNLHFVAAYGICGCLLLAALNHALATPGAVP